jgi:hypothetical protein
LKSTCAVVDLTRPRTQTFIDSPRHDLGDSMAAH